MGRVDGYEVCEMMGTVPCGGDSGVEREGFDTLLTRFSNLNLMVRQRDVISLPYLPQASISVPNGKSIVDQVQHLQPSRSN